MDHAGCFLWNGIKTFRAILTLCCDSMLSLEWNQNLCSHSTCLIMEQVFLGIESKPLEPQPFIDCAVCVLWNGIKTLGIAVAKVPGTPQFLVYVSSHAGGWNENLFRHNDMLIIEGVFFFERKQNFWGGSTILNVQDAFS